MASEAPPEPVPAEGPDAQPSVKVATVAKETRTAMLIRLAPGIVRYLATTLILWKCMESTGMPRVWFFIATSLLAFSTSFVAHPWWPTVPATQVAGFKRLAFRDGKAAALMMLLFLPQFLIFSPRFGNPTNVVMAPIMAAFMVLTAFLVAFALTWTEIFIGPTEVAYADDGEIKWRRRWSAVERVLFAGRKELGHDKGATIRVYCRDGTHFDLEPFVMGMKGLEQIAEALRAELAGRDAPVLVGHFGKPAEGH